MMNETSTKLLIVDDLPENLRALNALIRESDRSVYLASSGEEALAHAYPRSISFEQAFESVKLLTAASLARAWRD